MSMYIYIYVHIYVCMDVCLYISYLCMYQAFMYLGEGEKDIFRVTHVAATHQDDRFLHRRLDMQKKRAEEGLVEWRMQWAKRMDRERGM